MRELNTYYSQLYSWFADIPQAEANKLIIRNFLPPSSCEVTCNFTS